MHGGYGLTYSLMLYDVTDFRFCKNHISYGPFLKDSAADNKCILKKLELNENYNILPVGSPHFDHIHMKKNLNKIAEIIILPPTITLIGGISFIKSQAHSGPKTASVSIKIPTTAAGVV